MRFCYHKESGSHELCIEGELFVHLYKSRRTKKETPLAFCNLMDGKLHHYVQVEITKKSALLSLQSSQDYVVLPKKTHLLWAITESKNIEKTLPILNQLGVRKLSLFYANRSQRNEKISLPRLEKILIASCEQCGRSTLMELEILKNTKEALALYPSAKILHFGGKCFGQGDFEHGVMIGPEGGFDAEEVRAFLGHEILGIDGGIVLRSESAALFIAALGL
ncbi:16S rRNA (uracil(1498)-N(3))-methyltransferase [Helicobacter mustelae]|uniref:Ribosomal RNA small subunit methyltransferase E n=1 Tax=Helicobacter mustelae (strain ATCC 43772 / CCUG 25715 / CIP 103759 / LMG 18044 / NCTC 12198 / R85-136P) TaxID=679897 RepID=D3UFX3_HELM1|nr:16S rRNA (uracil(1498)-N(3))-methyltransferase [Helicobacter mustelae]CBG39394.1 putative RNA methyltransferase [Helicobacter mustelae 12198]SQH70907.1 RNA methyltransferase [Helicobacter mustelae]